MSLETTSIIGKKRKRFEVKDKDVSTKLTGKLHHYFKEVRKAAKKAKAFETQRLVKRLKDLREPKKKEVNPTDIQELQDQLEVLKKFDLDRVAYRALASKIKKDRLLSSNDALNSAITSTTFCTSTISISTPNPKIESKLLSSKILSAEVHAAVNGLKAVLELPEVKATSKVQSGDDSDAVAEIYEDEEGISRSMGDDDNDDGGEAHQIVDDGDHIVDDGGWESGSIHGAETGDESEDDEDGGTSKASHKRSKVEEEVTKPKAGKSSVAVSTFLPSLSVGFIKGSSDSEYDSDKEAPASRRKNRRGQRARQAIWEKKYGKGAKHLKKRQEEEKAAATARIMGRQLDRGWKGRHTDSKIPPDATQKALQARPSKPAVEKPIHPSWEAKKKLKEREGGKIVPPQGQKIVFT